MTRNILLTVAYDGTGYCGWQRQINGMSVQQRLEEALELVLGQRCPVSGASRTDAGVHALCQGASFLTEDLRIPLDKLPAVINGKLPPDISVRHAREVEPDFHPRFRAERKTYGYKIYNAPLRNPLLTNYAWLVPYQMDFDKMQKAGAAFVGTHDFAGFCATGGSAKTSVRSIYALEIKSSVNNFSPGYTIDIEITGNGFLYNMVRIIAGTLVYVGCGKIPYEEIPGIIKSLDRTQAGKTAPPQGLTLLNIDFRY